MITAVLTVQSFIIGIATSFIDENSQIIAMMVQ